MVKLIKNKVDVTGVAVLLLAFFVAVGFRAADTMRQGQWYEVVVDGNPADPNDQEITREYPTTEPVYPCADGEGPICAIRIDMKEHATVPATVAEAEALHTLGEIEILDRKFYD